MPLMTNAEAFHYDFGIYATELWAMPEEQFLEWLNANCDRERPRDMVVRCQDCKWWTKQEASLQGRCDAYGMYPTGEWYCARGERKDI